MYSRHLYCGDKICHMNEDRANGLREINDYLKLMKLPQDINCCINYNTHRGVGLGKSEQSGILIESLRWYKISICPVLIIDIQIMKILVVMKI